MQIEVFNLAKRWLLPLNADREKWGYDNCMKHEAFATKNKCNCMECGKSIPMDLISRKRVVCPSCNTKLTVKSTLKRTLEQTEYLAICEIVREYQVFRYFKIESVHKIGEPVKVHSFEVLQHWIHENGKREVIGRQNHSSYWGGYSDSWGGLLEIRDKKDTRKYDVYHSAIHPSSEIKDKYKMYGINCSFEGMTLLRAIENIPNCPKQETLAKINQFELLSYSQSHYYRITRFWDSIKICIRNKKRITDPVTFFDYLELLCFFRKDVRSPKYLFPKNLKKEHDRLVAKKREIERKQEIEEKKRKAMKHEELYKELKGHFFGLEFKENDFVVKVMDSVQQFVDEGDLLKHCVYVNEYFKRKDSLILSARKQDEVLETIELDLKEMKVIQSRGKYNQPSPYNNEFIRIVEKNLSQIEKLKTA